MDLLGSGPRTECLREERDDQDRTDANGEIRHDSGLLGNIATDGRLFRSLEAQRSSESTQVLAARGKCADPGKTDEELGLRARARSSCDRDELVGFSWKGRGFLVFHPAEPLSDQTSC
jgi:hypothetical protein